MLRDGIEDLNPALAENNFALMMIVLILNFSSTLHFQFTDSKEEIKSEKTGSLNSSRLGMESLCRTFEGIWIVNE